MFYFAHPFGISSPLTADRSTGCDHRQQPHNVKTPKNCIRRNIQHPIEPRRTQSHVASYIPWPENTWRRDDNILPTLVQALATQMGEFNVKQLFNFKRGISEGPKMIFQYATA